MLDRIVVILMPSLNPDGHQLVTDWHTKMQGMPFEGGQMPWAHIGRGTTSTATRSC
jgi:hypothetical protein